MLFPRDIAWLFSTLFLLAAAQAQRPAFKQEKVHARDAYVLPFGLTPDFRLAALSGFVELSVAIGADLTIVAR